jgi:ribonuclease T2
LFKTPQSMIRTVLAVMLMVGLATLQQRCERTPARSAAVPPVEAPPSVPATTVPTPGPAAPSATAGFDFYVLALSWSPTHCASDAGQGRDDDLQCRSGRPYGFVLHGLWPQNERGWPAFCASDAPVRVKPAVMQAALELSPSEKLVQHEWAKHGTCSGLSQEDYFAAAARAVGQVQIPPALKSPERPLTTTPDEVRAAFLAANPELSRSDLAVTCRRNLVGEVRVCLDRDLRPRRCSAEVIDDHCGGRRVRMLDVRGHWLRN